MISIWLHKNRDQNNTILLFSLIIEMLLNVKKNVRTSIVLNMYLIFDEHF